MPVRSNVLTSCVMVLVCCCTTAKATDYCLWCVNSDGTSLAQLATFPSQCTYEPVFCPNGETIAFVKEFEAARRSEIWRANVDGSGLTQLTNPPGGGGTNHEFPYDWTSNNNKIVFRSERANHNGFFEVWTMSSDGSAQTDLGEATGCAASFSPDGSRIAYCRWDFSEAQVKVMDANGSNKTVIHTCERNTGANRLTWLASDKIVFQDGPSDNANNVYIIDPSGAGFDTIAATAGNDRINADQYVASGSRLVFFSNAGSSYDIYTANLDGTGLLQLTSDTIDDAEPLFSPDGTKIIWVRGAEGSRSIWIMNADGTGRRELAGGADNYCLAVGQGQGGPFRLAFLSSGTPTILSGSGPQTRVIRVTNNGNPVPGCSVYVKKPGQPEVFVGFTDSRGERRVPNIEPGDSAWAVKKVHTERAVKAGHEAVDNTMYELWMDTKELVGSYEDGYDWLPYYVGSSIGSIDLDLGHPLFKWNLVVSTEWNVPDSRWDVVRHNLDSASNWLYQATDGQMKLGRVAVYEDWQRWWEADIRVSTLTWLRSWSHRAIYDRARRIWEGGGIRSWSPVEYANVSSGSLFHLSHEEVKNRDPYTYQAIDHELGHYALGLLDEYKNGKGQEQDAWTYRKAREGSDFPYNYGLMDLHYEVDGADFSSWYCYLPEYASIRDSEVTAQFYEWRKPCWEVLKEEFEGNYGGVTVRLSAIRPKVNTPESTSIRDPQHETYKRKGPLSHSGCDTVIAVSLPGDCFDAPVLAIDNHGDPISGAWVQQRTGLGTRLVLLGGTDHSLFNLQNPYLRGKSGVLGVGLRQGDILEAYSLIGAGFRVVGAPCESVEIRLFPGCEDRPALADSQALSLLVAASVSGDSVHSLEITIVASETLAVPPSVRVWPEGGDSMVVQMRHVGSRTYAGSAPVGSSMCGSAFIEAYDTTGVPSRALGTYAVEPVREKEPVELESRDGSVSCFMPESCGFSRALCIHSVMGRTVKPYAAAVQIGVTFTVSSSGGGPNPGDSWTVSLRYPQPRPAAVDEDSLQFYRWDAATGSWASVGGSVSHLENTISATLGELGTFAAFGPPSRDTIPPNCIQDLRTGSFVDRRVQFTWTAPGDDSSEGQAAAYDVRVSHDSLVPANWDACTRVPVGFAPGLQGSAETLTLALLPSDSSYRLAIRAVDEAGNLSQISNTVTVTVKSPPIPVGSAPANQAYVRSLTPTFWWGTTLTDTGYYRLQYGRDPELLDSTTITVDSMRSNSYEIPDSMALAEGTYYWRVCAIDKHGFTRGYRVPPYQFAVDTTPPEPPVLIWPHDGQYVGSRHPRLIWTAAGGDWGTYRIELARDSLFSDSIATYSNVYDSSFRLRVSLSPLDTFIFWRVQATDGAGNAGQVSRPSWFLVDTMLPAAPCPILPFDGDLLCDSLPTFQWSSSASNALKTIGVKPSLTAQGRTAIDPVLGVEGVASGEHRRLAEPVTYRLQIAFNDSFLPCVVDTTGIGDTITALTPSQALADSSYYWRVEAVDSAGRRSGFAPAWTFLVDAKASIDGNIRYYSNSNPVAGAKLTLSGAGADTNVTDPTGSYSFPNLPLFRTYTITPEKRSSSRQPAVSSFDVAQALRHAVRLDTLDSLQFRAADVSGDSTVSAYDAALILRYAVGQLRHFPVGARPGGDTVDWAFRPPTRMYDSLLENQASQDYRGILYGDPSGNWPGSLMPASAPDEVDLDGPCAFFSVNMPDTRTSTDYTDYTNDRAVSSLALPTSRPLSYSTARPDVSAVRNQAPEAGVENWSPAVSRQPSADVVFPIHATAKGVLSADALVKYDTRRLKLTGIRTTDATEGFMAAATDRKGYVRVGLAGTRKLSGDLDLLELVFERVSGENPQIAPITPIGSSTLVEDPQITPITPMGSSSPSHEALTTSGGQPPLGSQNNGIGTQSPRLLRQGFAMTGGVAARGDSGLGAGPSTGRVSAISTTESVESVESVDSACVALVWLVLNEGQNGGVTRPTQNNAMGDRTDLPASFFLAPPMPNPFGQGTMVRFGLPVASRVAVSVFDITGREVRALVSGRKAPGYYSATWDGRDDNARHLANGIYFIRMEAGEYRSERKATLLRN